MKCLVVLENHFYLDKNNKVWADRVVDYKYLRRYLNVFDSILVTGRTEIVNYAIKDKLLVSNDNIEFVPMPDFVGIKGLIKNIFKIKQVVKNCIKQCDCAIYRVPTHISIFTYDEILKQHKPLAFEFMMASDKMIERKNIINSILNFLIDNKVKKMCLKANGVSYVTNYTLQKKYPCRALINGENNKYFTGKYSTVDLELENYYKQEWIVSSKPKVFKLVHIGYMDSYRKGQDILINIAKKIKDKGYDFELIFIGDGAKKKEFMELTKKLNLEKNIKFIGSINNKESILKVMRESHLFVFPTKSEGLPRTLIEAMSQSLPCIASPVDGIPELLEPQFLIDYKDIDGYVKKIIELFNDWELMIKTGKDNYIKSLEYSREKLEKRRNEFYKKLFKLGVQK